MTIKKKSIGGKISFSGFCLACIGLLVGIYIDHNFGAIMIWIAFFIFIFGMLKTWIDLVILKK